jgi:hypothetical protein
VQVVRSDNGREYLKKGFNAYFQQNDIIHQTSCVITPQKNGIAERKNHHLLEVAQSLCFAMQVPKRFWGDAILTATFLINRMPSRVLQFKTPLHTLSQYHSLTSLLNIPPKVFGCICYIHVYQHQRGKMDPRARKCLFVGYSATQKGYKCYHPPSGKVFVPMDVTFLEHEAYFPKGASNTSLQGEIGSKEEEKLSWDEMTIPIVSKVEITPPTPSKLPEERELRVYARRKKNQDQDALQDNQTDPTLEQDQSAASPENIEPEVIPELSSPIDTRVESSVSIDSIDPMDDLPIALKRQSRTCQSEYKYPISNYVSSHRLSDSYISFANHLSSVSTPDNLQNALGNPKWKSAMVEEMEALHKNSTWDLVELLEDKKTVSCKWVFTVKHKVDGSVERYKARLVAKGYTQTYGIDYHETFAPVAKINIIRVLLSLAANLDWPLQQFDVKNAFLHGELEEEVYMDLPPGFTTASDVGKVCKLNKSLYGLKQSPRAWFGKFSQSMKNYGFKQSQADHTLFLKCDKGKLTALIVYVDDMVVTGNDEEGIRRLRDYLAKEFEMKDLGALRYFLGIEVARSRHGIFLSQQKYVLDLLTETGMLACQPIDIPIEQSHKLGDNRVNQVPTNKERYQRLVGRLIYLSHTRPDLAYVVSVVS